MIGVCFELKPFGPGKRFTGVFGYKMQYSWGFTFALHRSYAAIEIGIRYHNVTLVAEILRYDLDAYFYILTVQTLLN
jgi:hypothetical protein